jgi:hypothetical protein
MDFLAAKLHQDTGNHYLMLGLCFSSHCLERYLKPWASTVISCITHRDGSSIRQLPKHPLLEGILTDSGCNPGGHSILYRSELGIVRSTTHI